MHLAKPSLDVGYFVNRIGPTRDFWEERVGLQSEGRLTVRKGWVQHRYKAFGSMINVTHRIDPFPLVAPSGFATLSIPIGRALDDWMVDPEGNSVRLVATGEDAASGIGITIRTPDPDRMMDFLTIALQFECAGTATARCGTTTLHVEKGRSYPQWSEFEAVGLRYLTVHVLDLDRKLQGIVARGGRLGRAATDLNGSARHGYVLDPDGNWIEIRSQRAVPES
jgi:lactoylglutathione lyase